MQALSVTVACLYREPVIKSEYLVSQCGNFSRNRNIDSAFHPV
jgi:hypothetical protein